MASFDLRQRPHRRFNPLTREWVLVSPHRTQRPWLGKVEKTPQPGAETYDPNCYLCPGNLRAGGKRNPPYRATFVFDNDYPALLPEPSSASLDEPGLLDAQAEAGICRVICFSPRHDLTITRMSPSELAGVVRVWTEQYCELGAISWVQHVQIFENRGALMGASNPHPHCQLWANASLPNQPAKELLSFREYWTNRKSCILCDYLRIELDRRERLVCQNESFVALVPFWAIWPFEVMILSTRHFGGMEALEEREIHALGELLRRLTTRYDNLFEVSFPYSMGFHQQPTDGDAHPEWHFHAHYFPPLLRSATIQKFMVGYEILATPQRDITPEHAAERLRDAGEVHYLDRSGTMQAK